jgi:hypothetical protein
MIHVIRRIVTGQTAAGGATVSDDPAPIVELGGGACVHKVWRAPHPMGREAPGALGSINPPTRGAVFRIAEFPRMGKSRLRRLMHSTILARLG